MKPSLAASSAPLVFLFTSTACNMTSEEFPIQKADAQAPSSTYVSAFSAMHAAIPASSGGVVEEY